MEPLMFGRRSHESDRSENGVFYNLNAPMSGAGVRSTEASAPLAC